MAILITGGAGYIGSHTVRHFQQQGESVVVYDHLGQGHKDAVSTDVPFYAGDLHDQAMLRSVFGAHDITAVIHFAAHSLVGESVTGPLRYYENNLAGTMKLLEVMLEFDVKQIVFSSTAAVYGEPQRIPIKEDSPTNPTNPYGETKLAMERLLHWSEQAYGIHYVALRYFNAAGADPDGEIGEDHTPESHLIPIVLQTALGQRSHVAIFGDDYDTQDGTCVRDYIHVMDLAHAHYLALKKLETTAKSAVYNLGNGTGFSVKEVIDMCKQVTERTIQVEQTARRAGDPAVLIASSAKATEELGWIPQYPDLKTIVQHAWQWHVHHPTGYQKGKDTL
ncbi:UDP-glucose 4-epimerase [Fictibacillus macauensis ZFHKF-1]|uniref:UDP-glucose 4-epimerase n=1 Tax=Fictibacillus macauensis ZFHKF-1 TaxID=1196324 RepID=I8IWL9_9BACL|nr:UDP-glucose 4-epimerase GalE [Fictibacillus macauensis]EIT83896.1 UDP-glucose 4-epimerase [Fictibacillus macauensis ZFHKF-1]